MPLDQAHVQVIESYSTDVVANIATIKPINIGSYRGGSIAGADAATLSFYGSTTEDGTFELMENSAGTAFSAVHGANQSTQIPEAVFMGARFIKIINDAAQEDFRLTFKS